jgi:hypothetical protein
LGRLGGFCLRFIWPLSGIPGIGLGELTFLFGWRNESLGAYAYIAFTALRFVPQSTSDKPQNARSRSSRGARNGTACSA